MESTTRGVNRFFLVRLGYFLAAFAFSAFLSKLATTLMPPGALSIPHDYVALLRNGLLVAVAFSSYALLVRILERRPASEVGIISGAPQFAAGALLGIALIALIFGALWLAGMARFDAGSGTTDLLRAVAYPAVVALMEELLFRVILFIVLEQIAGSAVAVVVSAALFGLAHAANPGVTPIAIATLSMGLGILLALTFVLTRNVGLPAGLHMGWNFAQAFLFGADVSGLDQPSSLLRTQLTGPVWLTGGSFGIEGSVLALGACLAASAVLLVMVVRRGRWRHRRFKLSASLAS